MVKQSFEELMASINETVEKIEHPETGLEESLKLFETGSTQIAAARKRLEVIEHQFEVLQHNFEIDAENNTELPAENPKEKAQETLGL